MLRAGPQRGRAMGKPMVIAITDESGTAARTSSGWTAPRCSRVDTRHDKAYTAISFGIPSHAWHDFIKDDPPLDTGRPARVRRLVVFGGGYPIMVDGEIVGGIGVSGGHYTDDHEGRRSRTGGPADDGPGRPSPRSGCGTGCSWRRAVMPTAAKVDLALAFGRRRLPADRGGQLRLAQGGAVHGRHRRGDGRLLRRPRCGAELQVLAANLRGVERAAEAGADTINVVVADHRDHEPAQCPLHVDEAVEIVGEGGGGAAATVPVAAIVATAFACPYEGPVDAGGHLALVDRLVDAGVGADHPGRHDRGSGPGPWPAAWPAVRARSPGRSTSASTPTTPGVMGWPMSWPRSTPGSTAWTPPLGGLGGCPFAGKGAAGNVASEEVIGLLDDAGLPIRHRPRPDGRRERLPRGPARHPLPSRRLALFRATGSAR